MTQIAPPTLDTTIYERNLAALRKADPTLADRLVKATDKIMSPTQAVTRDGKLSFQTVQPDGMAHWLGRTSIPSVRAPALLANFEAGEANVLLPGIREGTETYLLTRQLSRHRAVFVWEQQTTPIGLVLRLHDLADAITDERVVFIVCSLDELTGTLVDWLNQHPGHLCPDRIMMWPWQQPGDLVACRSAIQAAYTRIEERRNQVLGEQRAQLASLVRSIDTISAAAGPTPSGTAPSLAMLSLHARDDVWRLCSGFAQAARGLGWRLASTGVQKPGDVHPLARLSQLAVQSEGGTDCALLLEITRHDVRDIWPANGPVVSWFGPLGRIDPTLPARLGKHDPLVVTSSQLAERAIEAGVEPSRVSVCPLPCLATAATNTEIADSSVDATPPDTDGRPIDVAVVANLAPTDPESHGHRLPTHMRVWNTAIDLLKARIDAFTENQIEPLLARAEEKVGSRIEDAAPRRAMVHSLGTSVANTLLWRAIVQTLVKNDISVAIRGHGWSAVPDVDWDGPAGSLADREAFFRRAKIVVHADVTGTVSLDTLLAAGAGAVLLARRHPEDDRTGGLVTLLALQQEMVGFRTVRELVAHVRWLLEKPADAKKIADRARRRCLSEHSPECRLRALWAVATSFFTAHPG